MSVLILTPREYGCRQHGQNLTRAVEDKVGAGRTVVTSLGFRRSSRLPSAASPFVVDIVCPGDDQREGWHTKRFRGSYRVVQDRTERAEDAG